MRIPSAGEQFGTVLATRQAGRFFLRESRYAPSLGMPSHHHDAPYFSFVVRGAIRESGRRREHLYEAGSLHFHPAADPHSGRTGPLGLTCLSVVPHGRLSLRLDFRAPMIGHEPPALAALATRAYREFHASDSASDLALEALCMEIAAAHLRASADRDRAAPPRWLAEARDFLHARLDRPVPLAELAAVAGVHPAHLARTFRLHLGSTPGAYLRRLRIERARHALATSTDPIATIALAMGFSSQAHFTRTFHRLVGLPPAAYRQRHGGRAT